MSTATPPTTPTPRRRWLQFSLRTLLIVVAWSAVVVWMNTTPHYSEASTSSSRVTFGWPWTYNLGYRFSSESFYSDARNRYTVPKLPLYKRVNYWAVVADVAVGVLLVTALTAASEGVFRRVPPADGQNKWAHCSFIPRRNRLPD
jgi:hypothetical protein